VRAVVDTNIWVLAVLNPRGAPAQLQTAYLDRRFTVVASAALLDELEEVLTRPKLIRCGLRPADAINLVGFFRRWADLVQLSGDIHLCRDPKDDMVIETAVRGNADVLVSNDKNLTDLDDAALAYLAETGVRVLSPHQFLQLLDNQ
jgi:putative PIN family toxin of toxin-antitoxin system